MSIKLNSTFDDVDLLIGGDRFPVTCGSALRRTGWKAGTWVMYVPNENTASEFTVEVSDGTYVAGFLLFGSEDYADARQSTFRNFTSYQNTSALASSSGASVLTLINGGARVLFKNFETQALNALGNARDAGDITYNLNEPLKVSENGLLCNDPDNRLALAIGADPITVGQCSKVPDDGKLGIDLKW